MAKFSAGGVAMKTLDLGCGQHRYPGSIGIDINPHSNADVIHDLDVFPYPFEDNFFDLIYCDGIIEHLTDVVSVIEELWRISKPNGRIIIITPYFTSVDAFTDPTHKHYFSARSFDYFTGEFPEYGFYSSKARLIKRKVEISFWPLPRLGGLHPQHLIGAHWLANRFTSVYERFFAYILPAQSIRFEFEVAK
jgi:SAM-dependent methyltransferase